MSELPKYVLERDFNAPRELVWRTWTEPELIARWYGPNVETIIHRLDVKPGGLWLTEMRMGGSSMFQRAEYTEIVEPERLTCLMSSSDSDWAVTDNPMIPNWPRVLLTTVTLEEIAGGTRLRLEWTPHEASQAEIDCFAAAIEGMDTGWATGMALLEELLAELQSGQGN